MRTSRETLWRGGSGPLQVDPEERRSVQNATPPCGSVIEYGDRAWGVEIVVQTLADDSNTFIISN